MMPEHSHEVAPDVAALDGGNLPGRGAPAGEPQGTLLVLISRTCAECAQVIGEAHSIAEDLGGLTVQVFDADSSPAEHATHSAPVIPTIVVAQGGQTVGYLVGALPIDVARARVAASLGIEVR